MTFGVMQALAVPCRVLQSIYYPNNTSSKEIKFLLFFNRIIPVTFLKPLPTVSFPHYALWVINYDILCSLLWTHTQWMEAFYLKNNLAFATFFKKKQKKNPTTTKNLCLKMHEPTHNIWMLLNFKIWSRSELCSCPLGVEPKFQIQTPWKFEKVRNWILLIHASPVLVT